MKTYARIQDGMVVEIIRPAAYDDSAAPELVGQEIPIADRYTPAFVETLVDITEEEVQPQEHWRAVESDGVWSFSKEGE